MLNRSDGFVHLIVDAEEYLKNLSRNFFVFNQVFLRALSCFSSSGIIAHMLD